MEEKVLHLFQRSPGDVADIFSDGRPLIRVDLVGKAAYEVGGVSVGLVQIPLFELFDDDLPLYLQTSRVEVQAEHAVGLQPEGNLDVVCREGQVIVRDVVVRPRVVLSARILQGSVIVGNVDGPAEHQVFKQMGKARVVRSLITGTHLVEEIECSHLRAFVLAMHDSQSIG